MKPLYILPIRLLTSAGFLATLMACNKIDVDCPTEFPRFSVSSSSNCKDGVLAFEQGSLSGGTLYLDGKRMVPASDRLDGIPAGPHLLRWVYREGCTLESNVVVPRKDFGRLFTEASRIISRECGTCHGGNNPHAGIDLNDPCRMALHAERIRARAVDGNPSPMPPAGLMTDSLLRIVDRWLEAGGGTSD